MFPTPACCSHLTNFINGSTCPTPFPPPRYSHPLNPLESSALYPASTARGAEPPLRWPQPPFVGRGPWARGCPGALAKGPPSQGTGVPGTQLWHVNPQGFSPTYLPCCWYPNALSLWPPPTLHKSSAARSLLCRWKRDLPEAPQLSPGTAAARQGKGAQFLQSVGPCHFPQPAKLHKRGDPYFISSLQHFSSIA